jgi:AmiR/NasT family two-component response regulator
MLTGRHQIGLARRVLALGARSYITKPFDPEQVKTEVDRVFNPSNAEPSGRPWRVVQGRPP